MKHFLSFLRSKVFAIQLGLALVVMILVGYLVLQWLKGTTNHGEFVEVPDFSKMSVTEMRKKVEDSGLRYQILDSSNYNPDYPRFSILEQNPTAGKDNPIKIHFCFLLVQFFQFLIALPITNKPRPKAINIAGIKNPKLNAKL